MCNIKLVHASYLEDTGVRELCNAKPKYLNNVIDMQNYITHFHLKMEENKLFLMPDTV